MSGYEAALKEVAQLHKRTCFTPLPVKELTDEERRKAVEALLFLTEKRDKSITGGPTITGVFVDHTITRVARKYYTINHPIYGDRHNFPFCRALGTPGISIQSYKPGEQNVQTIFSVSTLFSRIAGFRKSFRTVLL